jgi:acyl carrier protein
VKIKDRIIKIIADEYLDGDIKKINEETSFNNDLNFDSLDRVELRMTLEEELGMKISDEDADQIDTVRDIISCLERRQHK